MVLGHNSHLKNEKKTKIDKQHNNKLHINLKQ